MQFLNSLKEGGKMSKKRILSTILTILVILLLGIVTSVYYISETVQFKEIGVEYLKVFNTNFIERVGILYNNNAYKYWNKKRTIRTF